MKSDKLQKIYNLPDDKFKTIQKLIGFDDEISREMVVEVDDFLQWVAEKKLKLGDAVVQWKDRKAKESREVAQIEALAQSLADASFSQLPQMAAQQHEEMKKTFIAAYQKRIAQRLLDPKFKADFEAFIETGDLGKLQAMTSLAALPGS